MEQLFHIPELYTSIMLNTIHYGKVKEGWCFPNHRHSLFEFLYCASGTMEQIVNGHPYVLKEGDALIIKYGLYHNTSPVTDNVEFFVFHFDIEDKEVQSIFQIAPNPMILAKQPGDDVFSVSEWVKCFVEEFKETLTQQQDQLKMAIKEKMALSISTLRMQTRVLDFISLLADYFLKTSDLFTNNFISPSKINLAHKVAYLLEFNLGEHFQINELAQQVGVNRSYLSDCFKRVYGIPPKEYFTKIKIRSAKQFLQHTDHTLEKISELLHFSSPAHFSKFFTNAVGLSPLKYRNQR